MYICAHAFKHMYVYVYIYIYVYVCVYMNVCIPGPSSLASYKHGNNPKNTSDFGAFT